jgi:hypothetical protein
MHCWKSIERKTVMDNDDISTLAIELGGKLNLTELSLLVKYLTFIGYGMAQNGQQADDRPTAAAPKPKGGKAATPVVEDETPF